MDLSEIDLDKVDFCDPYDIGGFVSLISQAAINIGVANSCLRHTVDGNRLKQIANKLVRRLDTELPRMSVGDAFMIISSYDFAHRVAYGRGAEQAVVNRYILNAFESMIHGDKSIDEYAMYGTIEQSIRLLNRAFIDRPLRWSSICLERWYKNFMTGKAKEPMSDYDTIMTVSILLDANLDCFVGNSGEALKKHLFNNHRHYLDKFSSYDWNMLKTLEVFLHASYSYLSAENFFSYQEAIREAQINSPTTNRYLRKTILMQRQGVCA